jgi:hypothetical protein
LAGVPKISILIALPVSKVTSRASKPIAKNAHDDTTSPYIPAGPQDVMAALLRTPPPPAGDKSTRKVKSGKQKEGKSDEYR